MSDDNKIHRLTRGPDGKMVSMTDRDNTDTIVELLSTLLDQAESIDSIALVYLHKNGETKVNFTPLSGERLAWYVQMLQAELYNNFIYGDFENE